MNKHKRFLILHIWVFSTCNFVLYDINSNKLTSLLMLNAKKWSGQTKSYISHTQDLTPPIIDLNKLLCDRVLLSFVILGIMSIMYYFCLFLPCAHYVNIFVARVRRDKDFVKKLKNPFFNL